MFGTRRQTRHLFVYRDGARNKRRADPLEVWRILQEELGVNFDDVYVKAWKGDPEAVKKFTDAGRKAFDVTVWAENNDQGLTHGEVMDLVNRFCDWADSIKKKQDSWQSIQPSTESPPSYGETNNSDSTSTVDESKPRERVTT